MNGLLSATQIMMYICRALVVLLTIPFHESAHALVSHWLGDDTAVRAGRLSLNPMRHFDPLGALCMLVGGVVTSVFRTPYMNVVKVQFLKNLKIFVGTLLFVVPGIYWDYCYALVPYLLAENPYMTTTRAMQLSKDIMDGEKFHYFVLGLSFAGWILLCMFTLGIGYFFLEPYRQATDAEFYAAMRSKALAQGLTTTEELGGFVRHESY